MPVEPISRGQLLLAALLFEGGAALLAVALGQWWEIPIVAACRFSGQGLAWGVLATVPPVAALLALIRYRPRRLRRLLRLVERRLVPLLGGGTWYDYALIALLAGVGEEFLFRGLLQGGLAGWIGTYPALLGASLLFGLAHPLSREYVVLAAGMGLYLGGLWLATDNLLAPIVTHALYDFVALLILCRRDA